MLGVLLLGLSSCGGPRPAPPDWIPPDVAFAPDETLVCGDPAEPGCAQPTPFETLIERAFDAPDGKRIHYVGLLNIGDEALLLRVHLIRAARESIYLQQFIWSQDATGELIFDELVKAGRRGVEVRIIGDQLFTAGDARTMASSVTAHRNVKIKLYNPTYDRMETSHLDIVTSALRFSGVNQRMHNKLMVVDGKIGILGGRNHENKYFDRDPRFNFKDREILVVGPEVEAMVVSFDEYWNYDYAVPGQYLDDVGEALNAADPPRFAFEESLPPNLRDIDRRAADPALIRRLFVTPALRVEGRVEFFADAPGKPYEGPRRASTRPIRGTYWALDSLLTEVTTQMIVQTPYLLISERAVEMLRERRRENPDLEIIASTNSLAATDHFFVYAVMAKDWKRLLQRVGFRIHAFKPVPGDVRAMNPRYDRLIVENAPVTSDMPDRMPAATTDPVTGMHAKSIVVDERIAFVGSHNFDPRSNLFNTEVGILIWDERVARALKADILFDAAPQNSWVIARQQTVPLISFFAGFIETISRALPIGDVWPFRYSAYFELRDGAEPVPPGHQEFYERYENVGQFPGVEGSGKAIRTRLFGAVGGWSRPLM